jgi:hypothetical protein
MSGVQTGNSACEMCLKYLNNLSEGTTYRVHMPHVVAYVVRYVVGRARRSRRHGRERSRSLQTFFKNRKSKNREDAKKPKREFREISTAKKGCKNKTLEILLNRLEPPRTAIDPIAEMAAWL